MSSAAGRGGGACGSAGSFNFSRRPAGRKTRHSSRRSSTGTGTSRAPLCALAATLPLALAIATTAASAATVPFGYQTAASSGLLTGSTYAASAAYDPLTSTLYVVGGSYENSYQSDEADGLVGNAKGGAAASDAARPSDCYLTALALPNNPQGASGILMKSLGQPGVAEACTDVALLGSTFSGGSGGAGDGGEGITSVGRPTEAGVFYPDGEEEEELRGSSGRSVESSHLLVLGHTAPRGLLTDSLRSDSDAAEAATYGFGLDLTLTATLPPADGSEGSSIEFDADLLGGRLFRDSDAAVTYPIAGAVPPRSSVVEVGVGNDVRRGGSPGPEFAYLLMQTSDADPNRSGSGGSGGLENSFGFGSVPDDESDDGATSGNSNEDGDQEQDPTVPSAGGSSLTVKKVALTSTTGVFSSSPGSTTGTTNNDNTNDDPPQTNTMVGSTLLDQWTEQYAPLDGTAVAAADLLYVPRTVVTKTATQGTRITNSDVLLLAGSTRGFGPAFGQANPDGGSYDTDGFVTLLDPATGALVDPADLTASPSGRGRVRTSLRITSTFDGHDVVRGLCLDAAQTDHVNTVYVVGSTTGTLRRPSAQAATNPVTGQLQIDRPGRDEVLGTSKPSRRRAFVMKLNLDEGLAAEWVREYDAVDHGSDDGKADAYATGCAVSSVDGAVYVGGVVADGGRIHGDGTERHRHNPAGGDDVFLVRVDGATGRPDWTRQVGSRGDDRLASRGGVLVDGDGGAILVGTTSGSLMRSRENDADTVSRDAFVLSITGRGETVTPVDPGGRTSSSRLDGECYFVNDPVLYLVIVSIVSALCAFVLGHALRQKRGLSAIVERYSSDAREVKGAVVKKNNPRRCDVVETRHLLVQYVVPSSSGGRLVKRLDDVSKAAHQRLSVGSFVSLHVLPGHDRSGIILHELRLSLRRLWRDTALMTILLLASLAMSIVFASCLPWYGWVIAIVPLVVTSSLAWLLWRNAGPNMELVYIHGQGCVLSGRDDPNNAVDEWTDNDQTDDDNSSPNNANSDVV